MRQGLADFCAVEFMALVLCLSLLPTVTIATDIVVALLPEGDRGVAPAVIDGEFKLAELEAMRVQLDGGPVERVFAGHGGSVSKGGSRSSDFVDLALIYRFTLPRSENPLDAAYWLSKAPGVVWAEAIYQPFKPEPPVDYGEDYQPPPPEYGLISTDDYIVPDDPLFPEQNSLRQMHCPEAWAISTGSTNIVICAIDGGYTDDHPDLMGSMWNNPEEKNGPEYDTNGFPGDIHGWNFSTDTPDICDPFLPFAGHGVACTSVYSARGNNGIGIAGILWKASVMPTVYEYQPQQFMGARNVVYAADNGARVMQASFGGYYRCSKTGLAAFQYARDNGLLMFAVAGNSGVFLPVYPGAYPSVLAVAGVDRNDVLMGSNFGYWPEVSAPLDGSKTCSLGGGYGG
ncbi:S8 family serine peptidase, partial [bacterium]|nr:S8 family serine peptidase [bacterium]